MTLENTNIEEDENDVTPEPEIDKGEKDSAGAKAYEQIFEQQQKQIDALMKQNESLNAQIERLIEGGSQLRDEDARVNENTGDDGMRADLKSYGDDDDMSIDYLGKMIGGKHN